LIFIVGSVEKLCSPQCGKKWGVVSAVSHEGGEVVSTALIVLKQAGYGCLRPSFMPDRPVCIECRHRWTQGKKAWTPEHGMHLRAPASCAYFI
jgi:hypothetical protein